MHESKPKHKLSFEFKNTLVWTGVFLVCIYCMWYILGPYIPELQYDLNKLISLPTVATSTAVDRADPHALSLATSTLWIPSIKTETKILQLKSINQLYDQSWIVPWGSTPDKGGNTVIVAHRYLRRNQTLAEDVKTFYNLPKMQVGDLAYVNYAGKVYEYKVSEVFEVGPKDIWIEDNTAEPILTMYTCTPLWTSDRRFVVRAKLVRTL